MDKIRRGSEVLIRATVKTRLNTPPTLFNPGGGLKITLTDPTGAVILNDVAMTNESTGVYRTQHQTSVSSEIGAWVASFKATDSSTIVITSDQEMFQLVGS